MDNKIVKFTIPYKNDKSMSRLKKCFAEDDLTEAVIVGFSEKGDFCMYSNEVSRKDTLWLLEKAKQYILEG